MMNISTGTWVRTIILALAVLNQFLGTMGISELPISEDVVAMLITTIAALVAWWKNNSFTQAAIEGDKVMHGIKRGGVK